MCRGQRAGPEAPEQAVKEVSGSPHLSGSWPEPPQGPSLGDHMDLDVQAHCVARSSGRARGAGWRGGHNKVVLSAYSGTGPRHLMDL